MEYRISGSRVYIRLDKGDEILGSIESVCRKEGIKSGTFQGIGACDKVVVATYLPDKQDFLLHERNGMLEMVSLQGNIVTEDNGSLQEHGHGMFSYLHPDTGEIAYLGGHLHSARISYTAEILLDVVEDGFCGHKVDAVTGINVWKFA